jgi:hypothetical protein
MTGGTMFASAKCLILMPMGTSPAMTVEVRPLRHLEHLFRSGSLPDKAARIDGASPPKVIGYMFRQRMSSGRIDPGQCL